MFFSASSFSQNLHSWDVEKVRNNYVFTKSGMPNNKKPCKFQSNPSDCKCAEGMSSNAAGNACIAAPTAAPTSAPTAAPTAPTKAPTAAPTHPTKAPTTQFAGQYKTGSGQDNMANLKTNTEVGNATAIARLTALVSVSLVFILLLLAVVIFLVIKVKQLGDTIKLHSGAGSGGALTAKQQKKTVI